MKLFARIIRLIRINFILMRYNIDEILFGSHSIYPLRAIIYFNPFYWFSRKRNELTQGERIRLCIQELGPIFVKAGQIISTRRDLLPDDIAIELAKLQDRVPPFKGEVAKKLIEASLGVPIETVFTDFNIVALASASIAQVHSANLLSGESVVIKVLRPNVKAMIDRDIDLLNSLATLANRYFKAARYFKPKEIVAEIAQTLYDELDLAREGANATQLRRNFHDSHLLHIPKIYWEYSSHTVLVMERVHGIPVHDMEALNAANVNMKRLAERAIEIFFTQVFRDSFFHADLHPGNIFVDASDPENPSYIAVDFGIVGSLSHSDQRYLAENMLAFFKRDYQRVAELHIACGWLPPNTRIDQFEGAIRAVSEPIFEQPLKDISFGKLLMRLFQVARRFHINIQPQLVLLQKTLLSIEGLSRTLAPDLDVWQEASPQIEKWLQKQVGVRAFLRRVKTNLPLWSSQLPEFPTLIYEILHEAKQKQETKRFQKEYRIDNVNRGAIKSKYFALGSLFTVGVLGLLYLLIVH